MTARKILVDFFHLNIGFKSPLKRREKTKQILYDAQSRASIFDEISIF